MYETVIFVLPESGTSELIPHQEYVRLVRGEGSMPKYSGEQVRIADWYIKMDGNRPIEIENETYGFLRFDEKGCIVWPSEAPGSARKGGHLPENTKDFAWLPTLEERKALHEMVFQAAAVFNKT